jgi:hypothetical protein
MKIVIPSYNRSETIMKNTIKILIDNQIPLNLVYLFLANEEQKELYKVPDEINVVVAVKGFINVRNFIIDYFEDNEILIWIFDDIQKVTLKNGTLMEIFNRCAITLEQSPYYLMGLPPTFNSFFNKNDGIREGGLLFAYGSFYLTKNDKTIKPDLLCVEDYQRTLINFIKYGKVLRCSDILFKSTLYSKGGITDSQERDYFKLYSDVSKLIYRYGEYLAVSYKYVKFYNCEIPHIKFKTTNPKNYEKQEVIVLPKINPEIFKPLLEILDNHKFRIKENNEANTNRSCRKNFPRHKADIFGYVKLRPVNWGHRGKYNISRVTEKKIELYNELKRIADIIVPFKWSSVLVNNNVVCGKHLDASNIGESVLLSIGDYEGCNIVVNGKKYDAKYQPLIFNGSKLEHYTTDDLVGNKYSLVFYNILPDDFVKN